MEGLRTLEEQLLFEYECALEEYEKDKSSFNSGIIFAYESLLSNLQFRDNKQYVKREGSVFYMKELS